MLRLGFRFGCVVLFALLAANAVHAMPPLAEGELIGWDMAALRRLDGSLPSSENVFSDAAFSFKGASNYCDYGRLDVAPDGDVIAFDGLRNTLVRIDLETGAWHVISGLGVGTGPSVVSGRLYVEPRGSILQLYGGTIQRTDAMTGDRSVFLQAPAPPSQPGQFAEFFPQAIAIRPNGTIVMYSVVFSTGITQARLFDVDPETAARTPITYLDPTTTVVGIAATHNGDVLLLGRDQIYAVNALGAVRTLSGHGVGTGPALDQTQSIATDGANTIYVMQISADEKTSDLIAIDRVTGDRELVVNPNPPKHPQDSTFGSITVAPDGSVLGVGCGADLIRIDPVTGVRAIAFAPLIGTGSPISTGPAITTGSTFLTIDQLGRPLVGGYYEPILRIDPRTGNRVVVSSSSVGSGPAVSPQSLDVGVDGGLFAVNRDCGKQILRIDPITGNRTVVSENGIGPPYWFCPDSIAAGDDGFLYVAEYGVLHRVDPATGARSIFADSTHGSGPLWPSNSWLPIQKGPPGTLLGVDSEDLIYRLDLASGDRSIFFDARAVLVDSALQDWGIFSFAIEPGGIIAMVLQSIYMTGNDPFPRRLLRVDSSNGDVIDSALGFYGPIAVVPEPASALLALAAIVTLAADASRRGRL